MSEKIRPHLLPKADRTAWAREQLATFAETGCTDPVLRDRVAAWADGHEYAGAQE